MAKKIEYTADDLKKIKARLEAHNDALQKEIRNQPNTLDLAQACEKRDRIQELIHTLNALKHIDGSITLAKGGVKVHTLPFDLADCGLEDE